MSSPPVSKQTPFPTKATHLSDLGFPLKLKLTKAGLLMLALPTAWTNLNPCSNN